jgi:hypothetical protein
VRWAICSINCFFAHLAGTQELVRSSGGGVALGQLQQPANDLTKSAFFSF